MASVSYRQHRRGDATLKSIAAQLNLHPSTVSVVLNDVPGRSIPDDTRRRIKETARLAGYKPNILARSLLTQRTGIVGVMLPEVGDRYRGQIMNGIGDRLAELGYCYMACHHSDNHDVGFVARQIASLRQRGAEGLILIDTSLPAHTSCPVVIIGGCAPPRSATVIVLNKARVATLTIEHLISRGYRKLLLIGDHTREATVLAPVIEEEARLSGLDVDKAYSGDMQRIVENMGRLSGVPPQPVHAMALLTFNAEDAASAHLLIGKYAQSQATRVEIICVESGNGENREKSGRSVTVIRQPLRSAGLIAVDTLLHLVNGNRCLGDVVHLEPEIYPSAE